MFDIILFIEFELLFEVNFYISAFNFVIDISLSIFSLYNYSFVYNNVFVSLFILFSDYKQRFMSYLFYTSQCFALKVFSSRLILSLSIMYSILLDNPNSKVPIRFIIFILYSFIRFFISSK